MKRILFVLAFLIPTCALWSQDLVPFYDPTYEHWGYCNRNKVIVIYPDYSEALPFNHRLAIIKKDDYYGLINQYGEAVGECKYQKIYPFSEGLAAVVLTDKLGFINSFGEMVIQPKFENQKYGEVLFSEGRAAVLSGSKYGYIDQSGNQITDFIYKEAKPYNGGFAVVRNENSEFSFIDQQGKLITNLPGVTYVGDYSEGLMDVIKNEKAGYIDKTGKEVLPFKYSRGNIFSEGLAYVKIGKKQFFIDKTGKPVIELNCDELWAAKFSNGLALIKKDGKAGYINKKGEEVIPCQYESARNFKNGYAIVGSSQYKDGVFVDYKGVIDTTGKAVLPLIYNLYSIDEVPEHGLLKLYSDPAYGYVSMDGINYVDVYTSIKRISLEELFKPDVSEYPKYIVGDFTDFQLTDEKGTVHYTVKKDNVYSEYFRIKDLGSQLVEVSFSKLTDDHIGYDTEGTEFTGTLTLRVSWGDLPSSEAFSDTKEKIGFILTSPAGNFADEIKEVWGYYKIRAEELIVYVNFTDGKQYKLRGKRIYNNW